jgi:hypothetical protein
MRTSTSALDACVLPRRRSWDSKVRVTTCSDARARDGFTGCRRAPLSPRRDGPTVIAMSCSACPTWPLLFQDALITVAVTLVVAAGRARLAGRWQRCRRRRSRPGRTRRPLAKCRRFDWLHAQPPWSQPVSGPRWPPVHNGEGLAATSPRWRAEPSSARTAPRASSWRHRSRSDACGP